ncbi:MAG: SGNH/GDSL hydrolase family protein [Bythopirellula sp.]
MSNHTLHRFLVVSAVYVVLSGAPVWAGPFSDLIVFGDSLSDTGNVSLATFGIHPGLHYYDGRFSNGPAYADVLATNLGLGPLTPSAAGGGNFAHGAAQTSGTGFFTGLAVDDVDDQIDDFLARGPADPDALFVVLAGANDLFFGQTNVSVPVNNLVNDLQRLIGAQARNFLVMNIPLLGTTPRFNQNAFEASAMNSLSVDFNSQLAVALDDLEASHPAVDFFRLDVAELISDGIANPAAYGFTNVTDPAAPGLESGKVFYNRNQIVSDPDTYLFWDDIHPTAAAHAVLAEHALAAVRSPGDFNFDGDVNGLDFLLWQTDSSVGLMSDWQANFAPSAIATTSSLVPEPTTSVLALAALAFAVGRRHRPARIRSTAVSKNSRQSRAA